VLGALPLSQKQFTGLFLFGRVLHSDTYILYTKQTFCEGAFLSSEDTQSSSSAESLSEKRATGTFFRLEFALRPDSFVLEPMAQSPQYLRFPNSTLFHSSANSLGRVLHSTNNDTITHITKYQVLFLSLKKLNIVNLLVNF